MPRKLPFITEGRVSLPFWIRRIERLFDTSIGSIGSNGGGGHAFVD